MKTADTLEDAARAIAQAGGEGTVYVPDAVADAIKRRPLAFLRLLAAALAAGALLACGGAEQSQGTPAAPPTAQVCTVGDIHLTVDVERQNPAGCLAQAQQLAALRDEFEGRWGRVDLAGWAVHYVRQITDGTSAALTTWPTHTVDLTGPDQWQHELYHVQLGQASWDHHCWAPFIAWEKEQGITDPTRSTCNGA